MRSILALIGLACALGVQPAYDLLLKGGHVIDGKEQYSAV